MVDDKMMTSADQAASGLPADRIAERNISAEWACHLPDYNSRCAIPRAIFDKY